MAAYVMMRMAGRRKLRRLLHQLLLPRASVRSYDFGPGLTPALGL
jgi:hypothetical protein